MSDENVEIARRAWDAWATGQMDALRPYLADDVEWDMTHVRDWPETAYHGLEGVERFLREWLEVWDEYEIRVERIVPAPDGRIVSVIWQRGKGRLSGAELELQLGQVATLRDGLIVRLVNYDDPAEARRAAGIAT